MTKFSLNKLQACTHQAGGHFSKGSDTTTFVDDEGKFYKVFQDDIRGGREAAFYATVFSDEPRDDENVQEKKDFFALREFLPIYYGIASDGDSKFLVLEDCCVDYKKPCVLDAKLGFTTIYEWSDEAYKRKNASKDVQTTQSSLGYRITGFKTYDRNTGCYFFADRDYGKRLTPDTIKTDCWTRFASNGSLIPQHVYNSAIPKLESLSAWFKTQRSLQFFAASVLIIYEGEATSADEARVKIRFVDFAHTFQSKGHPDANVGLAIESMVKELKALCSEEQEETYH
mmetsp:Transcript_27851/g.51522  ORF Transcript_27851/g.51522 Transcript_27851/m.51522 type:complete len:285 (-) Transcript_27851:237-1091(-)